MAAETRTARVSGKRNLALLAGVLAVSLVLGGCGVHVTKDEKGQDKKVDIQSPFGNLHVQTEVDPKDTGIAVYPGARIKHDAEKDKHSANVDISSSFFGVKVVAVAFESDDPPDKLLAFYRDKLKSYGSVLECKGDRRHTTSANPGESKDLTCDDDSKHGVNINVSDSSTELKVGTSDRFHLVEVKPKGDGSEFALVYVQTRGKKDSI